MPAIFISYRREDANIAGRLSDRLKKEFGADQVFMDIDGIEPGEDFVEVIERTVDSSNTVLVVIGSNWLTITDDQGQRRLDNPEDFVRLEVTTALAKRIHVIPVLVGGSRMPRSDELPEPMAVLTRRHALDLPSNHLFHTTVDHLITILRKREEEARKREEEARKKAQKEPPVEPPVDPRKGRIINRWNWEKFEKDAEQRSLGSERIKAIRDFHDHLRTDLRADIKWGNGQVAWFGARWEFCSMAPIGVNSKGQLNFAFGNLSGSDVQRQFRERLRKLAVDGLGLSVEEGFERKFPSYDFDDWAGKVDFLLESLKSILPS